MCRDQPKVNDHHDDHDYDDYDDDDDDYDDDDYDDFYHDYHDDDDFRLDYMEGENVSTAQHKRLELKIRELESKLELEKTTKQRQDTQVTRQKEVKIGSFVFGVVFRHLG